LPNGIVSARLSGMEKTPKTLSTVVVLE